MYWHINNARGEVAEAREIGGGRLKLKNAAAFGNPTELNPIRVSVFAKETPVTMLRCHGRDGDDLLVSGPIEGFDDARCLYNMTAWNTPTAGDFNDLRDALEALRDGLAFQTVSDEAGHNWLGVAPVFHDPASSSMRNVSVSNGLPVAFSGDVSVVQSNHATLRATAFQGGWWEVNLAEGSTVAIAAGAVVGLAPGTEVGLSSGAKVGIDGPVQAAQSGAWSIGLNSGSNVIGKVASGSDVGSLYNGTTALSPMFATIDASAAGDNLVIPGAAGKRIRVLRWGLTAKNEVEAKWRSGSADITGARLLTKYASAGGAYCPVGVFQTLPGEALNLNLSAAVAVGGELTYVLV